MADRYILNGPWASFPVSIRLLHSLHLNNLVGENQQHWDMMFPFRVILSSLIFILPALALGTISR
jgi:hypothetical protein